MKRATKSAPKAGIRVEIEHRIGLLPSFFLAAADSPGTLVRLWRQACEAYLDNPLPSPLKERLFAYLSRFCDEPYCMARHAAFLMGRGNMAGNATCKPLTPNEVMRLLQWPSPIGEKREASLQVLASAPAPLRNWPRSGSEMETALLTCAVAIFLQQPAHPLCLRQLRLVLGPKKCERLVTLLSFIRTAHFWTETHPNLPFESDLEQLLAELPALREWLRSYRTIVRAELGADASGELSLHLAAKQGLKTGTGDGKQLPGVERTGSSAIRETEQQRQLDFFECLIEHASPCISVVRGKDLRFTMVNLAYEGIAPGVTMVGRTYRSVFPEAAAAGAEANVRRVLETGEPWAVDAFPAPIPGKPDATWQGRVVRLPLRPGEEPEALAVVWDITDRIRAEKALRSSEELQHAIFQALPAHVAVVAPDGTILAVNEAWERFAAENQAGGLPSVIPGANYLDVCRRAAAAGDPEVESSLAGIESVMTGASTLFTQDYPCHSPEEERWFSMSVVPFGLDGTGGVVISHRNITERRRSEQTLRESEARFHEMFEKHEAVKLVIDPHSGAILEANAAAVKFYGYSHEELCARRIQDLNLLAPEEVAAQRVKALNRECNHFVFPHRLASGEKRWVEVYSSPTPWQERSVLYSIIHDVTARVEAEEKLRASEERYRRLVETASEGICVLDRELRITEVNEKLAEIGGYRKNEVIGHPISEFMPPEEYSDSLSRAEQRKELTGNDVYERSFYRKDGTLLTVLVSVTALRNEAGESIGSFGMVTDITERKLAEQALRGSEAFLARVLHSSLNGVYIHDLQRRVHTFINRQCTLLTGYTLDDFQSMIGPEFVSLVHPDDRERVDEHLAAVARAADGDVLEIEYRLRTADAHWIWCLSRDSVFSRDDQGQPREVIGTFLDITRRKTAEEAMQDSEERYRLASVATNDSFWDFDLSAGRVSWNENYSRLYGRPLETANSLEWWIEHIHPDDREQTVDSLRAAIDGRGSVWVCEYRFQRADGQWACIDDHAYIPRDSAGNALRVFGAMRDLTAHKEADKALIKSQERLRLAQAAAKVGIWDWDLATGRMECTPEWEQMFGYEPGSFPETYSGFLNRIHPNDLQNVEDQRQAAVKSHNDFNSDFRVLLPSGHTRWISCMGAAEYDEAGRPKGLFGASLDITARKQTETELATSLRDLRKAQDELMRRERLAVLEHLAGRVAHEVRTPLAVILNGIFYLEQLQQIDLKAIREVITESRRAVGNVDRLITEMLEFVREPTSQCTNFPVGDAISRALELIQIPETAHLQYASGDVATIPVCANVQHVSRILVILLENALQAIPESGELKVDVEAIREDSGTICVEVRDSGCGIPEENLKSVFEPLFSTKTTGIGLGLSIALRYARLNGGEISVQSQVGRGSTFRLTLKPAGS